MNVGTIKLLCWLASFVMATALTLGAGHFLTHIDQHSRPVATEYLEGVLSEDLEVQIDVQEWLDYKSAVYPTFVQMNWTGKEEPKKVVGPTPEGVKAPVAKRPVADILAIWLIQQDQSNPGGSLAYAALKDGKGQDLTLHVGDFLPAPHDYALVHAIHEDGVEFAFTDDRENEIVGPRTALQGLIIATDAENLKLPGKDAIPAAQQEKKQRPATTQRIANNHFLMGEEDLQTFGTDYSRILTEDVRTRTYYDEQGNRAGVEIQSVAEGSIGARHGAQAGDVVVSINGHKVTSEQEAISYVKAHGEEYNVWTVEVLRLGRLETIVYNSK